MLPWTHEGVRLSLEQPRMRDYFEQANFYHATSIGTRRSGGLRDRL